MKTAERHHISYNPPIIEHIPRARHQRIHDNVPIVSDINLLMRQYYMVTKLCVLIANWKKAYEKDFNECPIDLTLKDIQKTKKRILKQVAYLIKDDLKKVKDIKGIGPALLGGLLAFAHPKRFPTLHRYLYYCGYTKASKITKKYNRRVCSLVYGISCSLVRHKNPKYYPLYLKIKEQQSPSFPKIRRHRVALNRIGTIFLKEFYALFEGKPIKAFI